MATTAETQPMVIAATPVVAAAAPAPTTMQVTCPEGVVAGALLQVQGPSGPVNVQVPAGVAPGQVFMIQVPAAAPMAAPVQMMQQPAMMASPGMMMTGMAPPNMGGGGGLEMLEACSKVFLKQRVELFEAFTDFETCNSYEIYNAETGQLLFILGESSECCERQCCKNQRSFEMLMTSAMGGGQVLANFERPLKCTQQIPCILQEMTIAIGPQGSPPVGKIEQQCTLCMPKFNVINAQGAVMYELSGPLCVCDIPCIDVEFFIKAPGSEDVLGKITKTSAQGLNAIAAQMFTQADNFMAEFPPGATLDQKMVLLGGIILLDFMFFENSNEGGSSF